MEGPETQRKSDGDHRYAHRVPPTYTHSVPRQPEYHPEAKFRERFLNCKLSSRFSARRYELGLVGLLKQIRPRNEVHDLAHHARLLIVAQIRKHGKRHDLRRHQSTDREIPFSKSQRLVRILEMQRNRIMDSGADVSLI